MASTDTPVMVDDTPDDDSGFEDGDQQSQTTSLKSNVTKHIYENGRRYHSYRSGAYWGPNDEQANDTLDLFHHIFNLALDGALYLAPISRNPHRVLDLGTGTGIWAIDFADSHPSAAVVATDLSPIQPTLVPPNLEFQIDDFTCLPWPFRRHSFDFIHARSIYGCVADYPALYSEVCSHLQPGGWFEQTEISVVPASGDNSIAGTALERWGPLALEAGARFGKSLNIFADTKMYMERAGLVNVTYRTFTLPIGPWPKDRKMKRIGAYTRLAWEEGIEGWTLLLLTKFLGWRTEEVQLFCADIRHNLRDKKLHGYQQITKLDLNLPS